MDESSNSSGKARGAWPATPGWVKGLGIVAILFLVVIVILHLTGHGMGSRMHAMPGMH